MVLAAARGFSLLTGAVPLLLKVLTLYPGILQRPFLIYELDMNSGNAIHIRFQFRCSLMGADGRENVPKSVGSGYTKLLILLEFSPISRLPITLEKG